MNYSKRWQRMWHRNKSKYLQILGLIVLLIVTILILNTINFAQDRNWKPFSPVNNAWSILAPGAMMPDSYALIPGSGQGSYTYYDSNTFFSVIYKDYSIIHNILPWKKGHLDKQRKLVVKRNKAKLISEEEFTMGDIIGREVLIQMPDKREIPRESHVKQSTRMQRFRMFFQGNRFYMILAVLPEEQIKSTEVNNYLNSFVLR